MKCKRSEDEILEALDLGDPEFQVHLGECGRCRAVASEFSSGQVAVAAAAQPPDRPIPQNVGPYQVIRRLGEGGMGVVYEARQHNPDRAVALKVVRGGRFVDEYRNRLFEREVHTLGRLRHAGIAAIFEAGRDGDGQPFFAMELVRGIPLTKYARDHKLSRRERLVLFQKVCDAVTHAHLRGVIHRDLKPSNILVDASGEAKILDFGLARITDPESPMQTDTHQSGRIMGTLPYMSPEEARGNRDAVDVRSDVYSLGVVFYELMTDALPYDVRGVALPEAVRVISDQPPRRPSSLNPNLRGDIETIAAKALEKPPARRYQSVAELKEDIERFLTHQPIRARRPSAVYQLRKFVARHPYATLFSLALLAIVMLTRVWVVRIAEQSQLDVQSAFDLKDLQLAITQETVARANQDRSAFTEAERWYRSCVSTFRRLERPDRAAPAMIELAAILIDRPTAPGEDKESDYQQAEAFLEEAINDLEMLGTPMRKELQRALRHLHRLYGPDYWDFPPGQSELEEYLDRVESEARAVPRLPVN